MKKCIKIVFSILIILTITVLPVYASNNINQTTQTESNIQDTKQETNAEKMLEMKMKEEKSLQDYKDLYGSDSYGLTAFLLDKIRVYSIPFGFAGIAIAALYEYVIGIRKLDVRDRGFKLMIAIISLLIICQILPLIFAIAVNGWRG